MKKLSGKTNKPTVGKGVTENKRNGSEDTEQLEGRARGRQISKVQREKYPNP